MPKQKRKKQRFQKQALYAPKGWGEGYDRSRKEKGYSFTSKRNRSLSRGPKVIKTFMALKANSKTAIASRLKEWADYFGYVPPKCFSKNIQDWTPQDFKDAASYTAAIGAAISSVPFAAIRDNQGLQGYLRYIKDVVTDATDYAVQQGGTAVKFAKLRATEIAATALFKYIIPIIGEVAPIVAPVAGLLHGARGGQLALPAPFR